MSDLHPEVAKAIAAGQQHVATTGERMWPIQVYETPTEFATRIAMLAAEKAREEQRHTLVAARDYLLWLVEIEGVKRGGVNIIREALEEAIRRGTP